MAERDSLHAFPAKMFAAAAAVKVAGPKAVAAGSLVLTQVTRTQVRSIAPAMYMRGVGARGAAIGVTFNAKGDAGVVRATGPLHLLERDTKAHVITPKGTVTPGTTTVVTRRGPGARLKVGDGYRRSVRHPGTRGQYPFAKGIAKGLPPARNAISATMIQATHQALR